MFEKLTMALIKLSVLTSTFIFLPLLITGCTRDSISDREQEITDRLKTVTDSIIENTNVPGIVALVVDHQRGIDWMYTAGFSDTKKHLPMDSTYTFRIGSNTKPFLGTVLLQLVDEGKLALTDKLSRFYPDFPKSDSITISMLCNMTGGVYDYFADQQFFNSYTADPLKIFSPEELARLGFQNPFSFSPGTGWAYTNTGAVVLGLIIEKITGNTLETEINQRIIVPLNLSHTGCQREGADFPGPHARGYFFPDVNSYDDMTVAYDISRAWAAGSMYSTPRDLQIFTEHLAGGGLLSDSLQKRRLGDMQYVGGLFGSYGLCLLRNGSFYGHGGTLWGFTSVMFHSVERKCTIIIYFNCDLESTCHPLNLFTRYASVLYGSDY